VCVAAGPVESSETPAVSAPRQPAPSPGSDDGSDDEFDHTHKPSVRKPPAADSTSGEDSDVDVAPVAKPKSSAAVEEEESEEEEEQEEDAVETFMQTSMDDSRPSSPAPRPTSSRGRDAVSAAPAPVVKTRRMSDEVSDLSVEEMI